MKIVNDTDSTKSWFCYNADDSVKIIALASGDLTAGQSYNYDPPDNGTGNYFVRFTNQGGGKELGGQQLKANQTITLTASNGVFHVTVS